MTMLKTFFKVTNLPVRTFQQDGVDFNGAGSRLLQAHPSLQHLVDLATLLPHVGSSTKREDLPDGHSVAPHVRLVCVHLIAEALRSKPANRHLE